MKARFFSFCLSIIVASFSVVFLPAASITYQYDSLDRVTNAAYTGGAFEKYAYDATGATPVDRLGIGVSYADKSNISRWPHTNGIDKRCRGNTWHIPYKTIRKRTYEIATELCEHSRDVLITFMDEWALNPAGCEARVSDMLKKLKQCEGTVKDVSDEIRAKDPKKGKQLGIFKSNIEKRIALLEVLRDKGEEAALKILEQG